MTWGKLCGYKIQSVRNQELMKFFAMVFQRVTFSNAAMGHSILSHAQI